MDFGKFKYEAAQKVREARKNQVNTILKTVRFGLKIDDHDYGTKRAQIVKFLKAGDKVKVIVVFRGREQLQDAAKLRETQMNLELQAANDARDAERETMKAMHQREVELMKLDLERYKTDADNATRLKVAMISHPGETGVDVDQESGEVVAKPDPLMVVTQALQYLAESMSRPKAVVRDESGRVVGVQ